MADRGGEIVDLHTVGLAAGSLDPKPAVDWLGSRGGGLPVDFGGARLGLAALDVGGETALGRFGLGLRLFGASLGGFCGGFTIAGAARLFLGQAHPFGGDTRGLGLALLSLAASPFGGGGFLAFDSGGFLQPVPLGFGPGLFLAAERISRGMPPPRTANSGPPITFFFGSSVASRPAMPLKCASTVLPAFKNGRLRVSRASSMTPR